jgi:hypothetical protein
MIRHVRYEEFVALKSEGAGDFDGFLAAVDALAEQMGDVAAHHALVDLRRASVPPRCWTQICFPRTLRWKHSWSSLLSGEETDRRFSTRGSGSWGDG